MKPTRLAAAILLFTLAGPTLSACGPAGGGDTGVPPAATTPMTGTEATQATPTAPSGSRPSTDQENEMRIEIAVGDQRFRAALGESDAARDLVGQLPVTLEMQDHGSVEKTGRLPSPLSLKGQPAGADPDVGDVGYYAPGNDFVLYYGDQSYYPGIVVLGQLEGDAAERLADMEGTITTTVSLAN